MDHWKSFLAGAKRSGRGRGILGGAAALAIASIVSPPAAHAFEFDTGVEDLKARWDNTVKYSTGIRLKHQSPLLTSDANTDDGDRNFNKGKLISNRLDVFSEFDLKYKDAGLRLSGAAWYDSVYNRSNDNPGFAGGAFPNQLSVPFNEFPTATRDLHGRKVELLDAFVYGKGELGDMAVSGRAGKHTLLYGESLFFGGNGIAGAQAPIDYVKLLSVPNTQFKELIRPVSQISGQIQIQPNLAVGAYYQTRWQRDRLPGVGSYFSFIDVFDAGGERAIVGCPAGIPAPCSPPSPPFTPGVLPVFLRGADIEARNSGQGGIQLRYRPESLDAEFGLYAAKFHSKEPVFYLSNQLPPNFVTGQVGTYQLVFPQDIKIYGASVSTTVADVNVAAEVSFRRNQPLQPHSGRIVLPDGNTTADNDNNVFYPVGNSAHAQISWIALLKPNALWQGGSFIGEIAWNRRLSVTKNATYGPGVFLHAGPPVSLTGMSTLDDNATRDATAIRMLFAPEYFQVFSGVDLTVPIGVGYGISGKSSVLGPLFATHHGGDLSIGLSAEYLKNLKAGISYTHFFGGAADGGAVTPPNMPPIAGGQNFSYAQLFKDRDFISFTAQYSF